MSNSHANWLRRVADEIAKAGHYGWGNTCEDAAEHIDALEAELAALRERAGRARVVAAGYKADAERWRYIRRKLCLTGNGDGTCAMQAINLPAAIQGWPEPGQVAEFCDAAIDAAIEAAMSKENIND